jgi:hypothetical protein
MGPTASPPPPKESRPTYLIALKDASSSDGFEPANLGSSGTYDNN